MRLFVLGLTGLIVMTAAACRRGRDLGPPRAVPVATDGTLELRLMTFNIRYENDGDTGARAWRNRIAPIVRMIREEAPDVLGIQEALHGQAADLWASLPDYEFFGSARDDGARAGEYTAVLYRRDRFEPDPADSGTFWLSDTPETPGTATWGNEIPRTVTWLRLTDRASHRTFHVFNTHWDHQNQNSRLRSAELIARRINDRLSPEDPVVLLGDFNALPHNPAVATLIERADLKDTYQSFHPDHPLRPTFHYWRGAAARPIHIDHILIRGQSEIQATAIRKQDDPMLSDHFPVTARVIFH